MTFCCCSLLECLLIVFGGATPIFADLKDSRRVLMVLWKISCTSFSSSLTLKWLRLYLCRCCEPENKAVRVGVGVGELVTDKARRGKEDGL